ncbi:MAG: sigma-70 family RNA polymerase sigma factor [Prolixibacteraceae bacterium]
MTQDENDVDWFKRVFNDHFEYIRNYLYYLSGNITLAEDLTQDVFLTLWEEHQKIRKETVRAFLYTVAKNLYFKHHRKTKINLSFINSLLSEQNQESPEFILELKEFDQKLQQAISEIPEKTRIIFLMSRLDRMTYSEIAGNLKLSAKAVEKHMTKALKLLKEKTDRKL